MLVSDQSHVAFRALNRKMNSCQVIQSAGLSIFAMVIAGVGAVRRFSLLGIDLFLVIVASVIAIVLRENFELSSAKVLAFLPYLVCTLAMATVVISVLGLNRSIWRFSTMTDYLHLLAATGAIVLGAVVLGFVVNRLEGVARSIPVLQAIMILLLLVGARVFMRVRHTARRRPVEQFSTSLRPQGLQQASALIVGINRLAELFLQSAEELSPGQIHVAGLIGHDMRHTGRLMHRYPVLGTPEQLREILNTLEVHGVVVDRIVVTAKFEGLSPEAQAALREISTSSDVRVEFLATSLGLGSSADPAPSLNGEPDPQAPEPSTRADLLTISEDEREVLKRRPYWTVKRAIDVVGGLILAVLLAPVMALVTVLVLIDVGRPVVFWQQRPGLGGVPFKVYKLRTMGSAFDASGRPIPDNDRLSAIGWFLRRSRLDELPQLFNILIGQMSFIGPRPLLPVDQSVGHEARLLVRPGLTGWAQVKGGRHLSALDKVALDVWYVRNASLIVDLKIVLRTAVMVIFGEKENQDAVRRAWDDIENPRLSSKAALVGKSRSAGRRAA